MWKISQRRHFGMVCWVRFVISYWTCRSLGVEVPTEGPCFMSFCHLTPSGLGIASVVFCHLSPAGLGTGLGSVANWSHLVWALLWFFCHQTLYCCHLLSVSSDNKIDSRQHLCHELRFCCHLLPFALCLVVICWSFGPLGPFWSFLEPWLGRDFLGVFVLTFGLGCDVPSVLASTLPDF